MITATLPVKAHPPRLWSRGEGFPVLFLHAYPLDASQWDHQVAALSDRYRCIRADFWGANGTDVPNGEIDLARYAAALVDALIALGVTNLAVVGLSLGGYVALELLAAGSLSIPSLVLANTHCFGDDARKRFVRETTIRALEAASLSDADCSAMVAPCIGPRLRAEAHVVDPQIGRMRRWNPSGLIWAQCAMAQRVNRSKELGAYRGTLTCIGGEDDAIVPPARITTMASLVPAATVEIIPSVGHFSNLEDPPAFTALCERALGKELA